MIPINCLSQALDRVTKAGGYLLIRLSAHWKGLHVMWMHPDGGIEQFAPPGKLSSPWEAFIGYEGAWIEGDRSELAKPIPATSLMVGSWVLAWGTTGWWVVRSTKAMWQWMTRK